MGQDMNSETTVGSWTVTAIPVTVEYSFIAIEEIRSAVIEGYQKFSRGGIEVGGVLYGTFAQNSVRVLATRPVACQHALGPSFLLSESDKEELKRQLASYARDSSLDGFCPVGWYVSHTRSEICLTEEEVEIFDSYFSAPWQVALVVRPGKAGAARAGFFVREADGTLKRDQSHQEFDFPDRLASIAHRPSRERAPQRQPIQEFAQSGTETPVEEIPETPLGSAHESSSSLLFRSTLTAPEPYIEPKRNWSWVLVALLIIATAAVAVIGIRYLNPFLDSGRTDPLSLSVFERDGQLRIQWNQSSRTVKAAANGLLSIKDGQDERNVTLASKDLSNGSFTYARKNGDVQVRLTVEAPDGAKTEEASTFLGGMAQARDPDETDSLRLERDSLQDEVARLRADNIKQADRILQLERAMLILRSRLGIAEGQK
jgi:hypothetical protein